MIISASRRTDIPAFYADWFINRIRAGFCEVPHPFRRGETYHTSLAPEDVDLIIFWTRNPRPLFVHLDELDQRGYRYYFLYTILGYPRQIDPHSPPQVSALRSFRELSERVGPARVIWRYDPILFTQITPPDYHAYNYAELASALRSYTERSVISLATIYHKTQKRLTDMTAQGAGLLPFSGPDEPWFGEWMRSLAEAAGTNGMTIQSCASEHDLSVYGVAPGKCIDDEYIHQVFGIEVPGGKDRGQRPACGCVPSKDIGAYDTCLYGCAYCYATSSFERARGNYELHDPEGTALITIEEPG